MNSYVIESIATQRSAEVTRRVRNAQFGTESTPTRRRTPRVHFAFPARAVRTAG